MYTKALESYVPGTIRNFAQSMLVAREEAIEQEKGDAQYLTEGNMIQVLFDIFAGGTETTIGILQWLCLKMTREPEIQAKIQKEIEHNQTQEKQLSNLPLHFTATLVFPLVKHLVCRPQSTVLHPSKETSYQLPSNRHFEWDS
uniref:Putative cytochrome n=1 Tax=Ixodes ricinus TaxID=34613 RepID=A0A0K8RLC2_IXORI